MLPQADLLAAAQDAEAEWESAGAIDWSQAEQLVQLIKQSTEYDQLVAIPAIAEIVAHADNNKDWDEGVVGAWPQTIVSALENSEYRYCIEPNGDEWDVIRRSLAEEDWTATVDTYTIAELLVKHLTATRYPEVCPTCQEDGSDESMLEDKGPGTYAVSLHAHAESDTETVTIQAESAHEAYEKAMEQAMDALELELMDKVIEVTDIEKADD